MPDRNGIFGVYFPFNFRTERIMKEKINSAAGLQLLKKHSLFWSMLGWPYDPPRLNDDGKPIMLLLESERIQRYHRDFYRAGIKLHTGLLFSGWTGIGKIDYAETDRTLEELFACGDDILYLPRIKLNVPLDWGKVYPEEMCVYYPGTLSVEAVRALVNTPQHDIFGTDLGEGYHSWFKRHKDQWTDNRPNVNGLIGNQSFASRQWLADAGDILARLIRHLEDGPYGDRIIGYQIAYGMCGETTLWRSWDRDNFKFSDYGFCCRRSFYDWGIQHYSSPEKLGEAWQQPEISRNNIRLPSPFERELEWRNTAEFFRAGAENRLAMDYDRFLSDRNVEAIEHFCRIVKQESNKIAGAFYGYYLNVPRAGHAGHLGLDRLLASPDIDFFAAPKAYRRVAPGEPGGEQVPAMSVNRRKLFVDELDNRTHLTGLEAGNMEETRTVLWRELAKNLSYGSAFWWMDLGGGWFDSPEIMRELARIEKYALRLRGQPARPVAEVLVVSDDASFLVMKPNYALHSDLLVDIPAEIQLAGAPVDHYRFADLETLDLSRYKVICFLNCLIVPRGVWQRLLPRFRPDAAFVWHYAPGIRSSGYDPGYAEELCGMKTAEHHYDPRSGVEFRLADGEIRRREFHDREYPLFQLSGSGLQVMGTYADGAAAFARCAWKGHLHYCCCPPLLRNGEYRAIFDAAKVHCYAPAGNTVYADSRFAGIFSRSDVTFPLALPKNAAEECLTGKIDAQVQMHAKDARFYLYE